MTRNELIRVRNAKKRSATALNKTEHETSGHDAINIFTFVIYENA